MTTVKTFTFAVLHFFVAFSVGYVLTGSIAIGGLLALIEPTLNTIAFFFHERFWQGFEKRKRQNDEAMRAISESADNLFNEAFANRPFV